MQTPSQVGISGYGLAGLVVRNTFLELVEVQDEPQLQPRSLTDPLPSKREDASGEVGISWKATAASVSTDLTEDFTSGSEAEEKPKAVEESSMKADKDEDVIKKSCETKQCALGKAVPSPLPGTSAESIGDEDVIKKSCETKQRALGKVDVPEASQLEKQAGPKLRAGKKKFRGTKMSLSQFLQEGNSMVDATEKSGDVDTARPAAALLLSVDPAA
eukprot:Skav229831  [mRNA]  locus=scaffold2672:379608:380255:+ [translate_table: standard]